MPVNQRRTPRNSPAPDAQRDAEQRGLVTDEGVNEDRTGAHGPTLEEGERTPHAERPQPGGRRGRGKAK
jgi:hypothetical protein